MIDSTDKNVIDLYSAVRVGNHDSIRELSPTLEDLESVCEIQFLDDEIAYNITPLMAATYSKEGASIETVQLLLDLGAPVNQTVDGRSAAYYACPAIEGAEVEPRGDLARFRLLLESGCPMDFTTEQGNRIFCANIEHGFYETMCLMLDHGANPNGRSNPNDSDKQHGEQFSAQPGKNIVRRQTPIHSDFEIPLHMAAQSGSLECLQELLSRGADVQAIDDGRETALWCAKNEEMIGKLVELGLDLEAKGQFSWTVLADAVIEGIEELPRMQALVKNGANVNAHTDKHGYTLFMSAAGSMERDRRVLEYLVEAGADPHAVSDLGYNAFHAAIDVDGPDANTEENISSIFGYLSELGVNLEQRNNYHFTPLGLAIALGNDKEIRALVELGADVNTTTQQVAPYSARADVELYPAIFAAICDSIYQREAVSALIAGGVCLDVTDRYGLNPLECAIKMLEHRNASKHRVNTVEKITDAQENVRIIRHAMTKG